MTSPGSDWLAVQSGTGYAAAYEPAMRLALAAASDVSGSPGSSVPPGSLPEVPVGAVVLDADGEVIGQGRNACLAGPDPTAHAEIVAIRHAARRAAAWRLDGCAIVVTLEPCTMCAGAILAARIGRLVYGAPDPRAGAAGSLWDVVRDRRLGVPVEVIPGVLAGECAALLSEFFGELRRES